jgi:homocysteine S-methyltransferase
MTARYRDALPFPAAGTGGGRRFLTDSGIETDLIHHHGADLPEFASFPLLADPHGRSLLADYYLGHGRLAGRTGFGFVLDTVTWRASSRWGTALGYDVARLAAVNRAAVGLAVELRDQLDATVEPIVLNGVIGPCYDGYDASSAMTADQAQDYHSRQIDGLADTDLDLLTAVTIADPAEAVGIVRAARERDVPVVVSFTVGTDGRLPQGSELGKAIEAVDAQTDGFPAYFMINCAHPDHFRQVLDPAADWITRLRGVRVNASTRSHLELDEASDLDEGDPVALGHACGDLARSLPSLLVFGGCCGSDLRHVTEIATQLGSQ